MQMTRTTGRIKHKPQKTRWKNYSFVATSPGYPGNRPDLSCNKDQQGLRGQLRHPSPPTRTASSQAQMLSIAGRWERRKAPKDWHWPQRGYCQREKGLPLVVKLKSHLVHLHFSVKKGSEQNENLHQEVTCSMLLTQLSVVHVIFNPDSINDAKLLVKMPRSPTHALSDTMQVTRNTHHVI